MKVLIALLALVAVSQAAFTGSLQQRAQPLVQQAVFKMQLALPGRDGLGSMIAGMFGNQIQAILGEVQGHVDTAMLHAQSIWNSMQTVMQALGGHAAGLWEALPEGIQNLISGQTRKSARLEMQTVVDILNYFGLGEKLQQLLAAISAAHQSLSQMTMSDLMSQVLGLLSGRGWWSNMTGAIGSAISGAWGAMTDAASSAWTNMSNMASAVAGATVAEVQTLAAQFIADAQTNVNAITAEAAIAFQNMMQEHSANLGSSWGTLQETVGQIVGGANAPAAF